MSSKSKNFDEEDEMDNHTSGMESEMYEDGEVTMINGIRTKQDYDNCWYRFLRTMRYIWATKQTEDFSDNKSLYIKTTIRELVIYLCFVMLLCIITFGMRSIHFYWLTNAMVQLFTTTKFNDQTGSFVSMSGGADFWKFLTGPLINGLYWNMWYNNDNIDPNEINFIFYENKLLGVPRLRQVRVGNKTCNIPMEFANNITNCYAGYSTFTESMDSFGLANSTPWVYTSNTVLTANTFQGYAATYGGGGFYQNLTNDPVTSLQILMMLFNNNWIDRSTRAVIVEFTIYNVNLNLFSVVKLVAEFPPAGGVVPNYEIRTVKLIRYVNPIDYAIMACEIIFIIFLFYYVVEESIEIHKLQFSYFSSMWNILDITVIVMSIVCVSFNVYRTIAVQNVLVNLLARNDIYPNFDSLSYWQLQFDNMTAFISFLATIKIFKYVSFNKAMTQLIQTLDYCINDLIGFSLMFFIVFLAFAQLAYLTLGSKLADYREFYMSIFALFRIILNDYTFSDIQNASSTFGPIFFILYVFFVFFVLLNMFLAILDDAFGEVKEEMEDAENEFEITDLIKEKGEKMLTKLNLKKEKIMDFENAMSSVDTNNDGKMDFNEWKTELKKRGYAEDDIESLFKKFDTDGDRVLDENEQLIMLKELNDQKISIDKELVEQKEFYDKIQDSECSNRPITIDRYSGLTRRVDDLNDIIGNLTIKFDNILDNFHNMCEMKSRSKESKEKILNSLLMMTENDEEDRKQRLEQLVKEELINLTESRSSTPLSNKSLF